MGEHLTPTCGCMHTLAQALLCIGQTPGHRTPQAHGMNVAEPLECGAQLRRRESGPQAPLSRVKRRRTGRPAWAPSVDMGVGDREPTHGRTERTRAEDPGNRLWEKHPEAPSERPFRWPHLLSGHFWGLPGPHLSLWRTQRLHKFPGSGACLEKGTEKPFKGKSSKRSHQRWLRHFPE